MSPEAESGPLTVAVVGAGRRGEHYAGHALEHPERMKVTAVAEPDAGRRRRVAEKHGIGPDMQFENHRGLLAAPKVAEAVINATRDREHHATAMPLLAPGYHMLLEKPIATTEREVREIIAAAKGHGRIVMVGHVLRYAPFYAKVKELVDGGAVGEVVSLNTLEAVSYHHTVTGYVRDRWHRREAAAPMLLAKCCHDLDIVAWLLSGVPAVRVASFGSLKQFRPENAPPGSTQRCLEGCEIERQCPYSARRLYLEKGRWGGYVFQCLEGREGVTDEEKLELLRTTSPYGRCVWHCDNDVVDHQSVITEFANGVTATHDMFGAAARPTRRIHIIGSKGELEGEMEAGWIKLRKPNLAAVPDDCSEEVIDISAEMGGDAAGHGGGDEGLIADFVATLRGEAASGGTTRIEDSLTGHLIVFAADRAMRDGRVVELG